MTRDDGVFARFRRFRQTRPFWGGLFVIVAGVIIGYIPLGPISLIIHAGRGAIYGYAIAVVLIAMGLLIWFMPSQRRLAAIVAVVASLLSFPLTNLGGFIAGMMWGIVGGAMAFGWIPDKPSRKMRKAQDGRSDQPTVSVTKPASA
ncbi:DUF6114 domain-containing protein [Antrihabitans stalactiti]|uniref:DUF6114 domain-containing protein n=1 Tax=Antrihabitans stalactiti TaxID=2584121 RepID=UPI00197FC9F6|nr:DUF6114 domain-containing protein [Antrihabitans stalactiti]